MMNPQALLSLPIFLFLVVLLVLSGGGGGGTANGFSTSSLPGSQQSHPRHFCRQPSSSSSTRSIFSISTNHASTDCETDFSSSLSVSNQQEESTAGVVSRRSFSSYIARFIAAGSAAAVTSVANNDAAMAYERRDVGDDNRSMITAAFNEAAYRTNNRLEAEGFKLDTREEEAKKLSDAMKSFSYDASTSSTKRKTGVSSSSSSNNRSSSSSSK